MDAKLPILILDSNQNRISHLSKILEEANLVNQIHHQDLDSLSHLLKVKELGLILMQLDVHDPTQIKLLHEVHLADPNLPVIVLCEQAEIKETVALMRLGCFDVIRGEVDPVRLIAMVMRGLEFQELKQENDLLKFRRKTGLKYKHPKAFQAILTNDPKMLASLQYAEAIAPTGEPVVLTGEQGVGKEMLAKAIHNLSQRQPQFIKLNALEVKAGDFQQIERVLEQQPATLFIENFTQLALSLQKALLSLLHKLDRARSQASPTAAYSRVILSAKEDLDLLLEQGRLHRDLFNRIFNFRTHLPPLRQRAEDIRLLAAHFVEEAMVVHGKENTKVPEEFYEVLGEVSFPGNIQQMRDLIYDFIRINEASRISATRFRKFVQKYFAQLPQLGTQVILDTVNLQEAKRKLVQQALALTNHNQTLAAARLGVSRVGLSQYLKSGELEKE